MADPTVADSDTRIEASAEAAEPVTPAGTVEPEAEGQAETVDPDAEAPLVWEASDASRHSPGKRVAPPPVPVQEPRSRMRKFVYLVVALMPFIAFVLLLPRGGEGVDEVDPDTTTAAAGNATINLAFPFNFESPAAPSTLPQPVAMPPAALSGTQCSDGFDNDRDGRVDLADSGCSSAGDNSEAAAPRRTVAPPPPPPPPAPVPMPAPPPPPPSDDPDPDPPPRLPPPGAPGCEPTDPGFPNCGRDNNPDPDPTDAPDPQVTDESDDG